jgi:hypothetical protein
MADSAFQTWSHLVPQTTAFFPPERFHFDVLDLEAFIIRGMYCPTRRDLFTAPVGLLLAQKTLRSAARLDQTSA